MSNNQNQGASIEAERRDFEREALRLSIVDDEGLERNERGDYIDEPAQAAWLAWQAARRTPAAAAGAGELPPLTFPELPEPQHEMQSQAKADAYTAEQMFDYARAAIAADRAQQAGAAAHALWCAEVNLDGAKEHIDELEQTIADLRAQLAGQGQGQPERYEIRLVAPGGIAGPWDTCNKDRFNRFKANPGVGDGFKHEVRALYLAAPASAQPADHPPCPWCEKRALSPADKDGKVQHYQCSECLNLSHLEAGAQPDQRESAAEGQDSAEGEKNDRA